MTLPNLTLDTLDPELDVASGHAPPDTRLRLDFNNQQESVQFDLFSTSQGIWNADFTAYDFDLGPGTDGNIRIYDEDGDAAQVKGYIPNPAIGVRPNWDSIEGWEWPLGGTVTITIDDRDTLEEPDHTATAVVGLAGWDPSQTWFNIDAAGIHDLQAGDIVTVTDGTYTKVLEVASFDITEPARYLVRSLKHNSKQYTVFLALIGIWVIFAFVTEGVFFTPRNLSNLFVQTVTTAILAIGMVLVIVTGHIDLSVGSVLGFAGAVCAMCMIKLEWGVALSVLATLGVGLAIGAWHGFWLAYRKVPAFIVSLASMLAFRGLIIGITGGQTQGLEMAPERTAEAFKLIGQGYLPTLAASAEGKVHDTSLYFAALVILAFWAGSLRKRAARRRYGFRVLPIHVEALRLVFVSAMVAGFASVMVIYLGIPWSVIFVMALALLFTFLAQNTTFGRHLYAIGGNPDAARLSGINVPRHSFGLFLIMGAMTAETISEI